MRLPFIPKDIRSHFMRERVYVLAAVATGLLLVMGLVFIIVTQRTPIPSFLIGFYPGLTPTPKNDWSPPQPTPIPLAHGKQTYMVSGGTKGTPQITEIAVDPIDPSPDQTQTLTVKVRDIQAITSITATLITDNKKRTHALTHRDGDAIRGVWQGSWTIDDMYDYTYQAVIEAKNSSRASNVTLTFR